jgi:hypothetical protein
MVYNTVIVGNVSIISYALMIATVDNSGIVVHFWWDIMDERTNVRTNVRTTYTI